MKTYFNRLLYNRSFITGLSGLLIVASFIAGSLAGLPGLKNGLMIAAAIVDGSNIAVRAWNSLRHKHISIELLVTIAAGGALIIGEYWESAAVTRRDRKSTRLNSSHVAISYAVFCWKKKKNVASQPPPSTQKI